MFNVEKFIECMKNTPCLWDRRVEDYSQKQSRKEAWLQIGEMMYDDWADVKQRIINERVDSMKNRWRHIRDSFVKHLNHLRRGNSVRKRRKYIYHDNLQFLLEPLGDDFKMSNSTGQGEEESYEDGEETSAFSAEETPKSPASSRRNSLRIANTTTLKPEPTEEPGDISAPGQVDAGELFLLSLLPDYQKLGEDEKIDFRIMCLEFFRAVRRNRATPNQAGGSSSRPQLYQ
uniref:MADF domain-containing protein n=1 Tax=Cuerna arida TaxID=1464854 RepID=A0A1B6FZ56_9HEMI